jgi:hypothetical protein
MLHCKGTVESAGNYTVCMWSGKKWQTVKERVLMHRSVILIIKRIEIVVG